MAYYFWAKLGITRGAQYEKLMERAQNLGWSFNRFQREAMKEGLSFRRTLMLDDWRKYSFVRSAKTYNGKLTQHIFYDQVVKKLREEKGWSWKEIIEFLKERQEPEKWTFETKAKERVYKSYLKEALPEKIDT